jgi:DNA processing protein
MAPRNLLAVLALHLIPGLGPIALRRALKRFGDADEIAYRLPPGVLASLGGVRAAAIAGLAEVRRTLARRADDEFERCRRAGIRLLTTDDADYPPALAALPDAPLIIYLRGEIRPGIVQIAVVGSRRATLYGRRIAAGLGSALAARGIDVISGGARGIDTCAHVGALEEGGRTVAVLGSGMLLPYPPENAALFERIAAQGALLTEFALDHPPHAENFPRRNRLISGLSVAVVVVEAGPRSGSLGTAHHALEQGREVMAVPGPVSSAQSQGCHQLIQQGAKLVQNVADILDELSPLYRDSLRGEGVVPVVPLQTASPDPLAGASDDERVVFELLDGVESIQLDDLAERVPFGIARLQSALLALELRGGVDALPGRRFLRRDAANPGTFRPA